MKSRKQKASIYESRYSEIPRDYQQRLDWMYEHYHITQSKADSIYNTMRSMTEELQYSDIIHVILYEEPEGSPRPRARYVNKKNLSAAAKSNPGFIQVYSLTGAADRKFMKQLITDEDFMYLDQLICTPCKVQYEAFLKTPSSFNATDTYLAELGIIRPICKPDFDNIEKKYADMYNGNVWIDDSLVISSRLDKYYSILPRIEITLQYLNLLYNKYQYDSIVKRVENGANVEYFKKK